MDRDFLYHRRKTELVSRLRIHVKQYPKINGQRNNQSGGTVTKGNLSESQTFQALKGQPNFHVINQKYINFVIFESSISGVSL